MTREANRGRHVFIVSVMVAAIALVTTIGTLQILATEGTPHSAPPNTPLNSVLGTSSGSAECPAGESSWTANCEYRVVVSVGTTITLESLDFELVSSAGILLNVPFFLSAEAESGCVLGIYNSTVNSWGNATGTGACPGTDVSDANLASQGSLTMTAAGMSPLPAPGSMAMLVLVGVGEFSGSVSAKLGT